MYIHLYVIYPSEVEEWNNIKWIPLGIKEVDLNTIHMSYFTLPLSAIDKLEIKR